MYESARFTGSVLHTVVEGKSVEHAFTWMLPPERGVYGPRTRDQLIDDARRSHAPSARVLEVIDVVDAPKLGPVTIMRRPLGRDDATLGSLVSPSSHRLATIDFSGEPAMPDDEFWEIVRVAEGRNVRAITRRLKTSPERCGAFQVALDRPEFAIYGNVGGVRVLSDDASLDWRCGVVLSGQDTFRRALASPVDFSQEKKGLRAEPLLFAAGRALSPRGSLTLMQTGIDISTGANSEFWGPPPVVEPRRTRPAHDIWDEKLSSDAGIYGVADRTGDPWYQIEGQRSWYAVHVVMVDGGDSVTEALELRTRPRSTLIVPREVAEADIAGLRAECAVAGASLVEVAPAGQPRHLAALATLRSLD